MSDSVFSKEAFSAAALLDQVRSTRERTVDRVFDELGRRWKITGETIVDKIDLRLSFLKVDIVYRPIRGRLSLPISASASVRRRKSWGVGAASFFMRSTPF